MKSWLSFVAAGGVTLAGAKLAGDALGLNPEIGDNPYSADFGKIKIGNTRIDIWGGYQQYVRSAFQFIGGKTVGPTGKVTRVGEGYKPITRFELGLRFLESKEAPTASLISGFLKGRTFTGEKFDWGKELSQRFIPIYSSMFLQDLIAVYKDNPELVWMAIPGFFGVGTQTYEAKAKEKVKRVVRGRK